MTVPLHPGRRLSHSPSLRPMLCEDGDCNAAMLVCPGGGYQVLTDHEGADVGQWLNSIEISAFILNYTVTSVSSAPLGLSPLWDALRAMRTIRARAKEWRIDPERIGVIGFSAGGHLAASLSTHYDLLPEERDEVDTLSARPDLAVIGYASLSFSLFPDRAGAINVCGSPPDPELIAYLSAEQHVGPDTPPAFLWHTSTDVTPKSSFAYALALKEHNVKCELHLFPEGPHGMGLAKHHSRVGDWTALCREWLKGRGFV